MSYFKLSHWNPFEYRTSVNFIYDLPGVQISCRYLAAWASYQIRKIAGAHAPGMPGTFSPPPRVSDPDIHHGTCVTHVPWCMPGSLTGGFRWIRQRGKRSRHSRRMRNSQFYTSGKRPMKVYLRASIHEAVRRLISWSLGAARLDIITIVSLWNLTGISAALLSRCLSNFRAIGLV